MPGRTKQRAWIDIFIFLLGPHVRFLEDIKSLPSISQFVEQASIDSGLKQAYNKAVQALTEFRSEQVSIVTSYVLHSKKSAKPTERDDSAPKQGSGGSSDLFSDQIWSYI
jgi:hypothetical protein